MIGLGLGVFNRPRRMGPQYSLHFLGNTVVEVSGLSIDVAAGYELRYKFLHEAVGNGVPDGIWGDTDLSTPPTNGTWLLDNASNMRRQHGDKGQNININYDRSKWLYVREVIPAGGWVYFTAGLTDEYTPFTAVNSWGGRTGTISTLRLGQAGDVGGLRGYLDDFKIYDVGGVLQHHIKIGGSAQTARDIHGSGLTIGVTLGAGAWV